MRQKFEGYTAKQISNLQPRHQIMTFYSVKMLRKCRDFTKDAHHFKKYWNFLKPKLLEKELNF